jgi:5,10-methylenetetrahydromethanopterin reductase
VRHGLLFYGNLSIADTVAIGRAAEDAGFDSLHYVEAYRSAFVALAALASSTRRVRLGTYIANAYAHSPFGMGLAALDLDELSGGRFVLGVGSGNRHLNELALGVGRADVHTKLREFVEVVRRMLGTPEGGRVTFEGKIHSMRWRQMLHPFRERIPVHLAAIFPKMIDVAATVADGVALGVLASPEYVRDVVRPRIRRAAEAAGRDPAAIEVPMGALVAVDDDRGQARDRVRAAIASFFHPMPHPYYEFLLREQGYSKVADSAIRLVPEGRGREAMEMMDDELVDRLALAGSPAEISKRLEAYRGLVDEVIYLNVGGQDAASALEAHRPLFAIRAPR